jgi:hypothetical protein
VFGKKAATVIEEKPRDLLAELHSATEALAHADEAINQFRSKNYVAHDGVVFFAADSVFARAALASEEFTLRRKRDKAMNVFQDALKVWSQFKTGGNSNAA